MNLYESYRRDKIDPILLTPLPISKKYTIKDTFQFPYKWNPFSGQISHELDENGPLYFDPDTLINYFYIKRLSNLWTDGYIDPFGIKYQGYYGDAVGNGNDFFIPGRGEHWDWYLFRLPILDCYIDTKCPAVTMGPQLTFEDVKKIDILAKKYGNNYEKIYHHKRPKLTKIYKLYEQAIDKNPTVKISKGKTYDEMKYKYNIKAVEKLKKL